MRALNNILMVCILSLLISCGAPSQTNIDYTSYDAVNDRTYVYSPRLWDEERDFYLQGRLIGGKEYLEIGYASGDWLFINFITMRFEHSKKTYKVGFTDPVRDVRGGGSITEHDTFSATTGTVGQFVSVLKSRNKKGLDTKVYIRGDGSEYYNTGEFVIKAGDYSLPGFFIHKGDPPTSE